MDDEEQPMDSIEPEVGAVDSEGLLKPVTITFPNGKVMSKIVNHVIHNRPIGWSRRSYASYYSRPYAEWLQKVLDKMLANNEEQILKFVAFPQLSENALYLRVNQAMRFLLEPVNGMDDKMVYNRLKERIKINRRTGQGITFTFQEAHLLPETEPFDSNLLEKKTTWRRKMEAWVESKEPVDKPYIQEGLMLNEGEILDIEMYLRDRENIMYSVTTNAVKIIKS